MTEPANALVLTLAADPPQPTLHEPVTAWLRLENRTAGPVRVDLGHDRKGGLELSVEAPNGTASGPLRLWEGGMGLAGEMELAPGGEHRERLLLSEWHPFSVPGEYRVGLRLANPVRDAAGEPVTAVGPEPLALTVAPRDEARLAEVSRALADTVLRTPEVETALEAALALGHVRDPVAVPFLLEVARAGRRGVRQAVEGLGRIDHPAAREALNALAGSGGEAASLARSLLAGGDLRPMD
ncbi:MAG: HEAT repeat domain-containing protein [Longimicrobiaceae bacterium]